MNFTHSFVKQIKFQPLFKKKIVKLLRKNAYHIFTAYQRGQPNQFNQPTMEKRHLSKGKKKNNNNNYILSCCESG